MDCLGFKSWEKKNNNWGVKKAWKMPFCTTRKRKRKNRNNKKKTKYWIVISSWSIKFDGDREEIDRWSLFGPLYYNSIQLWYYTIDWHYNALDSAYQIELLSHCNDICIAIAYVVWLVGGLGASSYVCVCLLWYYFERL